MEAQFVLFFITSLVVILTPGQDLLLVLSRSISQGGKAGFFTVAGICTGLLGHSIFAGLGLGTLLKASVTLFTIVKAIGACYLFYLGIKLLRSNQSEIQFQNLKTGSFRSFYLQGAISNLSNPKILIFYMAFLPQFIPSNTANPTQFLIVLGIVFSALGFVIKVIIGFAAGFLANWIKTRPIIQVMIHRISGVMLIGIGIKLALEKR